MLGTQHKYYGWNGRTVLAATRMTCRIHKPTMESNRAIAALKRSRHQRGDVRIVACVKDRTVVVIACLSLLSSIEANTGGETWEKQRIQSRVSSAFSKDQLTTSVHAGLGSYTLAVALLR
ncbi:hypothetical protein QE152_g22184 [Popillia japonica]|uniref:Uncharacterized protein n=1 Tax=Popillia japonica TaxID=7064 RepID=A0AAW1KL48_POPJA